MKNRYPNPQKSPETPSSSSQYEEEINDKLNDLWSSMKRRKNQIIRSVAPSYSRKYDSVDEHSQSNLNISKDQRVDRVQLEELEAECKERLQVSAREIAKLKNRLAVEITNNKLKDTEIQELKSRFNQLLSERNSQRKTFQFEKDREGRKMETTKINVEEGLSKRRQRDKENHQSNIINESSIVDPIPEFEKSYAEGVRGDMERLLELLRSTEQYKEFVFYHNNNQLSFLRNLGKMRRRNCACNLSEREKTLWAPKDVLEILRALNTKDDMNLDDQMIERIVYNLNLLYLQREKVKLEDMREAYQKKIQLIQRKANASIPYDILQIQKQKQRELMKNRRSKSTVRK